MNGIIHNCTHANSTGVVGKLDDKQVMNDIFAYIDQLFSKIKPKKLFFLALDGIPTITFTLPRFIAIFGGIRCRPES